jgi:hypothetical protein
MDDWIKGQCLEYNTVYNPNVDTIYNPDVDQICYGKTVAYLRRAMCGGWWSGTEVEVTRTGSRAISPFNATNRQISSSDVGTRGCSEKKINGEGFLYPSPPFMFDY